MFNVRWDLGIKTLTNEWKGFLSIRFLREDLIAGITVACVSIPLSLAISLASGSEPVTGLITAIVASIVCALFGGTQLAVTGPAAAMSVLTASVIQQYQFSGLLFVGFICGILQLLTGLLGVGKIVRFIPIPVISGFTAGIGAIILIGQLPRALGLIPPDQSHVIDVILHIHDLIHETQLTSLFLTLSTLGICFFLPRFLPQLPSPLIAVTLPTIVVSLLHLKVSVIGEIPNSLSLPKLPSFHFSSSVDSFSWTALSWTSLMVFSLASLETLLSSSAVDKLTKDLQNHKRHDPDQELIGQGLGNILVAFFGGIPATGVIARTALNVQSGAKTRRAAIVHGLMLVLAIYLVGPYLSKIPMSVLAGVLLFVALRMLHPGEFLQLWELSRIETFIFIITFITTVFIDLVVGVQAGLVAALIIMAIRLGSSQSQLHVLKSGNPSLLCIEGSLSFLSSSKIENVRIQLESSDLRHGLIMDMSQVHDMDASGALYLADLLQELNARNVKVALQKVSPLCEKILLSHDMNGIIQSMIEHKEMGSSRDRLLRGIQKFKHHSLLQYGSLFKKLADNQNPHTLFITCSDSRINPNLITSTDPGELFIVRNVGNIIPPFSYTQEGQFGSIPGEGAAVEFAVGVLGVQNIVICGHSGCGAIKAILSGTLFEDENEKKFPSVSRWLKQVASIRDELSHEATPQEAAELNVRMQLRNLKTYPSIREKLDAGNLEIHGWYYDIGESKLEEWDENKKVFIEVGAKALTTYFSSLPSEKHVSR